MKRNRPNRLADARIDFAPFATLALVLFFALLILNVLGKQKTMSLKLADNGCVCCIDTKPINSRLVELFLDEKQIYLLGNPHLEDEFVEKGDYQHCYPMLVRQRERVVMSKSELIVLIKPMKNSNYGQLVSVLNNLKKAHLSRYTLNGTLYSTEIKVLKKWGVKSVGL